MKSYRNTGNIYMKLNAMYEEHIKALRETPAGEAFEAIMISSRAAGILLAQYVIREMPDANVREIKYTNFIEDGYEDEPCVCAYCGAPAQKHWNYCPVCGCTFEEGE